MFFQTKRKSLTKRLKDHILPATAAAATTPPHAVSVVPYVVAPPNTVTVNDGDDGGHHNHNNNNERRRQFQDYYPSSTTAPPPQPVSTTTSTEADFFRYQQFLALISHLKEKQLEKLKCVVEQLREHPVTRSDCILVPKERIYYNMVANVIACKLFRWPDLQPMELKRSPPCRSKADPVYICCNPSHWSRRVEETETPPPPYNVIALDRLKQEEVLEDICNEPQNYLEAVQRQTVSFSTIGEGSPSGSTWCKLAYWELGDRVGPQFPVDKQIVNVFFDQFLHFGEDELNFCLQSLAQDRCIKHESVLRTRRKIGLGIAISKETDGIWIYNRSNSPIFVHSPTLSDIENRTPTVLKVLPGHCLKAYDEIKAKVLDSKQFEWPGNVAGAQTGPVDIRSLRISFAKGWGGRDGSSYRRMDVTSCPCWVEVMMLPCR